MFELSVQLKITTPDFFKQLNSKYYIANLTNLKKRLYTAKEEFSRLKTDK